MQQARCIPCEHKALMNKQKLGFLLQQGSLRATKENKDYVIYEDSESNQYKLASFSEAIKREDRIIQVISRFESLDVRQVH